MIQRIIKLFISGIITTTNTKLSSKAKETKVGIQFNSILPSDITEAINNAATAKNAGIMSVKTAVKKIDMTEDVEEELALIESDQTKNPDNGTI